MLSEQEIEVMLNGVDYECEPGTAGDIHALVEEHAELAAEVGRLKGERDRLQAENAELLAKLERSNPMPVKRERTLFGDHVCPNCDAAFIGIVKVNGKLRNTMPYCGNCGQWIDWGEDA